MDFEFKNDEYRENRGGESRLIDLNCKNCKTHAAVYQKDGPGPLKFVYLDRIFFPENLTGLEERALEDVPDWDCPTCEEPLGKPYMFIGTGPYAGEERLCFRMFELAVLKRVRKLSEDLS